MSIFHTHFFKESQKDPEILYCHCGAIRDLHRHIWEMNSIITEQAPSFTTGKRNIGRILKCQICGELKGFNALDEF